MSMTYISTRNKQEQVSASQAIFRGLAPDGGLYLPETLPELSMEAIKRLCDLSYMGRAKAILPLFLTDFAPEEIVDCLEGAYASGFEDDCPAPISSLVGNSYFLELWHGPTCAFKDMALQLLPGLLRVAMARVGGGKKAAILVATSGDTGKAALEGFRDVEDTSILVFYPEDGVSQMQKRQMYTQQGDNVGVVAIRGNFDDAQTGVKEIFGNRELAARLEKKKIVLSSANSINWGRLLPQIVYYFSAYCDLVAGEQIKIGEQVNFCVPTGNFGNILAAHYARRMGLPIKTLVCASNQNNVLTDCIREGVYNRNRPFHATLSPSMDILISSNLERLLFELCQGDDQELRRLMDDLSTTGKFALGDHAKQQLQADFWGGSCDDQETQATIRRIFADYSYLCDPHTAVAARVAEQYRQDTGDQTPMVVVSTASPYKFVAGVLEALGELQLPEDDFEKARLLEQKTGVPIPEAIAALEHAERRFDTVCDTAQMTKQVETFLL